MNGSHLIYGTENILFGRFMADYYINMAKEQYKL